MIRYTDLDADVTDPLDAARVLRAAAALYRESESELSAAWQDAETGRPWQEIAKILDAAADRIDKRLSAIGY